MHLKSAQTLNTKAKKENSKQLTSSSLLMQSSTLPALQQGGVGMSPKLPLLNRLGTCSDRSLSERKNVLIPHIKLYLCAVPLDVLPCLHLQGRITIVTQQLRSILVAANKGVVESDLQPAIHLQVASRVSRAVNSSEGKKSSRLRTRSRSAGWLWEGRACLRIAHSQIWRHWRSVLPMAHPVALQIQHSILDKAVYSSHPSA